MALHRFRRHVIDTQSQGGGTLASSVYDRLRQDIITANFEPGTRLNIDRLAKRYEVGNSPIREALNRLSSEGLVSQRDQRGFGVLPVSVEELTELTRLSIYMNDLALRDAVAHAGVEWEESLILAHHYLTRVPEVLADAPDRFNPEWEARHREFHVRLINGCGSPWLIRLCTLLLDMTDRYRHLYLASGGKIAGVAHDHASILQAALDRDPDRLIAAFNSFNGDFQAQLIGSGALATRAAVNGQQDMPRRARRSARSG